MVDRTRHREVNIGRGLVDGGARHGRRGAQGDGVVVGVRQAAVGGHDRKGVSAAGVCIGGVYQGGQHGIDVGLRTAQGEAGRAFARGTAGAQRAGRQGTLCDAQGDAAEVVIDVTDRQGRNGQLATRVHQQAGRQVVDGCSVAGADGDRQGGRVETAIGILGLVGEGVNAAVCRARIGRVAVAAVLIQR